MAKGETQRTSQAMPSSVIFFTASSGNRSTSSVCGPQARPEAPFPCLAPAAFTGAVPTGPVAPSAIPFHSVPACLSFSWRPSPRASPACCSQPLPPAAQQEPDHADHSHQALSEPDHSGSDHSHVWAEVPACSFFRVCLAGAPPTGPPAAPASTRPPLPPFALPPLGITSPCSSPARPLSTAAPCFGLGSVGVEPPPADCPCA
mmetsp:Transcript_44255/g.117298  ORF Transcript_44255/g.117298 Transcript_44255/m.117298 type:complete len:203 (-) Transcript_44255:600-1208(-)